VKSGNVRYGQFLDRPYYGGNVSRPRRYVLTNVRRSPCLEYDEAEESSNPTGVIFENS
jgi:hypothetical protein